MIELTGIRKSYQMGSNRLDVLKGIDLTINEGELVSIMGSSGTGKSTLLNIVGILDNYDSGEYRLNRTLIKDLSETKAAHYRNRLLGFVFQSFNLVGFKNAMENVAFPSTIRALEEANGTRWRSNTWNAWDCSIGPNICLAKCRADKNSALPLPGPWSQSQK